MRRDFFPISALTYMCDEDLGVKRPDFENKRNFVSSTLRKCETDILTDLINFRSDDVLLKKYSDFRQSDRISLRHTNNYVLDLFAVVTPGKDQAKIIRYFSTNRLQAERMKR